MDAKVDTGTLAERSFPVHSSRGVRPLKAKWLGLVIVGLALAASVLWWSTRPRVPVSYVTAAVTRGAVAPYVTASGSVNPVVTVQVGTYVSGVIQELHCDFNTRVKKGQLCAKIDPRPYQTIVDQDKANLATARAQLIKDKANLEYARASDERARGLLALDSVSKDAADAARNAYEQAQAQVALDEAAIAQRAAELEAAQVNLDYTNIVSPVDGTVVSPRDYTGTDCCGELPDAHSVPDRHRPHTDAGRHQCERIGHRWGTARGGGNLYCRGIP
jgi:HlyD family secretion protein